MSSFSYKNTIHVVLVTDFFKISKITPNNKESQSKCFSILLKEHNEDEIIILMKIICAIMYNFADF